MDEFRAEWAKIGEELILHGNDVQYGNSLVEVKFADGKPVVIIRSKSVKTKYPDNSHAELAIGKLLHDSYAAGFDGARTFTVAYNKGNITQVILDEYGNTLLR